MQFIEEKTLKPSQKVFDLKSNQEVTLEFEHATYLPNLAADADDSTVRKAIAEAVKLFADSRAVFIALLDRARNARYTEAKEAALAKGEYLTRELLSRCVELGRSMVPQWADKTASETAQAFKAALAQKKAGALKILAIAKSESGEFADL